jgi:disulfide bond formation protein DsbB
MDFSKLVIDTFSAITLLMHILIVTALFLFLTREKINLSQKIMGFLSKNSLLFSLVFSLSSILGSLLFSELVKLPVCNLCVLQRISIYPLFLILLVGYLKKKYIGKILVAISTLTAAIIAVYHYYIQMFNKASTICTINSTSECNTVPFISFGYITIPLMTITVCVIILFLLVLNEDKTNYKK